MSKVASQKIVFSGVEVTLTSEGEVWYSGYKKKTYIDKQGYERVGLWIPHLKRTIVCRVHSLMALAFLGGYRDSLVVNHKDCNKANNNLSNLELISEKDNSIHATINRRNPRMKYLDVLGYNGSGSLFIKRLRLVDTFLFGGNRLCRKKIALAIQHRTLYNGFYWVLLEEIHNEPHD